MINSFLDFRLRINKQNDRINKWLGIYVKIWKELRALKNNIELNEKFSPKLPIKEKIKKSGFNIDIEVDGGINKETSTLVKEAGANILVSGSYIFSEGKENYAAKISSLR